MDDASSSLGASSPSDIIHGRRRIEPFPCNDMQEELDDPTVDNTAQHLN